MDLFTNTICGFCTKNTIIVHLSVVCFDVYISRIDHEPLLIDLNPYHETTDALLFSWPELRAYLHENDSDQILDIRFIESESEASQMASRIPSNGVPIDVIQFSEGLTVPEFAEKWQSEVFEASKALE
jgi:hypothetical protein